jgi:class 3 adenylate cyclase
MTTSLSGAGWSGSPWPESGPADRDVFATGGDGFSAAFSSAVDAVMAAVESQRELVESDAIPFGVRMGLHTGEAVERDRSYDGKEVNRAAGLMAIAHGGQVLVSDTAEVLVRSRVAVRPLGDHLLLGSAARSRSSR